MSMTAARIHLQGLLLVLVINFSTSNSYPFFSGGLAVPNDTPRKAVCHLSPDPNSELSVRGVVTFYQSSDADVLNVDVNITGLNCQQHDAPSEDFKHGFHVHQYGEIAGGCGMAGGHYNPKGNSHGGPHALERHIGDLGNLVQESDGRIISHFDDTVATLFGEYSIIGRAMVLHAHEDDLGLGGNAGSIASGNAGPRLACCIIGIAKSDD